LFIFSWDESANCCPDPWANYTVLQGLTSGQYAIAVGKPGSINTANLIRLCSGRVRAKPVTFEKPVTTLTNPAFRLLVACSTTGELHASCANDTTSVPTDPASTKRRRRVICRVYWIQGECHSRYGQFNEIFSVLIF
jgi:hypothetical protein